MQHIVTEEGYVEVDKNGSLRFALTANNKKSYSMFAVNEEAAKRLFSPRSKIVKATLTYTNCIEEI